MRRGVRTLWDNILCRLPGVIGKEVDAGRGVQAWKANLGRARTSGDGVPSFTVLEWYLNITPRELKCGAKKIEEIRSPRRPIGRHQIRAGCASRSFAISSSLGESGWLL